MSKTLIRDLFEACFEPFFREDILPELEVPETFSLSYETTDGRTVVLEIYTDILRALKGQENLIEAVSNHYSPKNELGVPWGTSLWNNENISITVLPGSFRISSYVPGGKDRCLDLTVYVDKDWRYTDGDLEFAALWMKEDKWVTEYAERLRKGKFSWFDFRLKCLEANTPEEQRVIREEAQTILELGVSEASSRYLSNFLAFMEML